MKKLFPIVVWFLFLLGAPAAFSKSYEAPTETLTLEAKGVVIDATAGYKGYYKHYIQLEDGRILIFDDITIVGRRNHLKGSRVEIYRSDKGQVYIKIEQPETNK